MRFGKWESSVIFIYRFNVNMFIITKVTRTLRSEKKLIRVNFCRISYNFYSISVITFYIKILMINIL